MAKVWNHCFNTSVLCRWVFTWISHRGLKYSLWPCLEPSFREVEAASAKKSPKDFFSAFIYAFLPLQKIFSYSQGGVHDIFLCLSPPCHCQVPEAPGAVSSPHDAWEPGPRAGSTEPWDKPSLGHSPGPQLPSPSLRLSVEMPCCPLVLLSLSVN